MKKGKCIIRVILEEIIKPFWILPIDKKKVLFFSFQGKQFSDSPKYLSEYINQQYKNYKIYWALNNPRNFRFLPERGYKIIKYGSFSFILHFITSKIIITNDSVKSFLPVRKKQIFLNTWHGGSPLKTCGLAETSATSETLKKLKIYEKKYTAFLSSSRFMTEEVFKKSFNYHGLILEFGMPRNEILLREHKDIKDKIYNFFHIEKDKLLVLYAPTFRDNNALTFLTDDKKLDVLSCLDALEKRFGANFCFLFRAHHVTADMQSDIPNALSASDYPDMQELLCAADVLITDYSSCMGDMALMYKPVFLYVPDLSSYTKDRGFYWNIHSLPFPLAETKSEFIKAILRFDKQKYEQEVKVYFEKLGSVESIDSIEKTCQWLFKTTCE